MGSQNLYRRANRGATPLGSIEPETPMPPDSMTGFSPRSVETLIVALCVVCTWTRVSNLLNRTLLAEGPVAARNKYGGYRNKTRSTVRLRRLSFPAVIITIKFLGSTQQGHHLACPNMPLLIILVTTRIQSHGHFTCD
jgi:hypothetical protein